ncbi:hypothetical protein P8C59_005826 [Phyllachora maydis]|uniref:Succinate dehydrogenase assembly factor 4, mitochondrial n=1 Tax=Phyllachora maydis TaxID=1825666 RepID=A0AAD9I5L8_9PEZI|nr:hypothetical protein P8C59_005826 [Phyllachora maydis]
MSRLFALRALRPCTQPLASRATITTTLRAPPATRTYASPPLSPPSAFTDPPQPSPPRLPPAQQAEFERLQRAASAALSSHNATATATADRAESAPTTTISAASLSGGIRKGAPPEFVGDRNPRTGEVGGPKNEPLRWGGEADWSYNGRVTDF